MSQEEPGSPGRARTSHLQGILQADPRGILWGDPPRDPPGDPRGDPLGGFSGGSSRGVLQGDPLGDPLGGSSGESSRWVLRESLEVFRGFSGVVFRVFSECSGVVPTGGGWPFSGALLGAVLSSLIGALLVHPWCPSWCLSRFLSRFLSWFPSWCTCGGFLGCLFGAFVMQL